MKEATGELSITVITVVAVAAVATLFYTLVWPMIQRTIVNNTCAAYGEGWTAVRRSDASQATEELNGANATNAKYGCCPTNQWSESDCI